MQFFFLIDGWFEQKSCDIHHTKINAPKSWLRIQSGDWLRLIKQAIHDTVNTTIHLPDVKLAWETSGLPDYNKLNSELPRTISIEIITMESKSSFISPRWFFDPDTPVTMDGAFCLALHVYSLSPSDRSSIFLFSTAEVVRDPDPLSRPRDLFLITPAARIIYGHSI